MQQKSRKTLFISYILLISAVSLLILQLSTSAQKLNLHTQQTQTAAATASQLSVPVTAPEASPSSDVYIPTILRGEEPTIEMTGPGTVVSPAVATYYVATNGNDNNPGTLSAPWRTIGKAARTASAGMIVYVRGGVYAETVTLAKSGTSTAPIQFLAYPGETPIVDAASISMTTWSALFNISGNFVQTSGFEVRNSKYIGVIIKGKYGVVDKFYSHHNRENGILIAGDNGTVTNSRVYRNALSNEGGKAGSWASGLSAARDADGLTENAKMINNTVWENWGEGVSSYEANGTIMQGNVAHDNFSTNIYISDSTNVLCKGNIAYMTPTSYVYNHGSNVGIMVGDEKYKPASANIQIIDNIAYGNKRNFYWWQGVQGGGMRNVLIAHNSFVNSVATTNVQINKGTHTGVRFMNNLIVQDGSLSAALFGTTSGIALSNNIWSKNPGSTLLGTGSLVGDPKLARSGSPYAADWYRLLDGSPALNKAKAIAEVTVDIFGTARGATPDMGATEK